MDASIVIITNILEIEKIYSCCLFGSTLNVCDDILNDCFAMII